MSWRLMISLRIRASLPTASNCRLRCSPIARSSASRLALRSAREDFSPSSDSGDFQSGLFQFGQPALACALFDLIAAKLLRNPCPLCSQGCLSFFETSNLILKAFDPLNGLLVLQFNFGMPDPGFLKLLLLAFNFGTTLVHEDVQRLDFGFETLSFIPDRGQRNIDRFLLLHEQIRASGKDGGENVAHAVSQFDKTPRLPCLPFEGVSLPVDLGQDVIDARQIQARSLQPGFGKFALRFELRNARGLFDQRTAIHGLRAEKLSDASLFDDCVTVGSEARSKKDVLNVSQTARLAVHHVDAFTASVEPPLNDDLARVAVAASHCHSHFHFRCHSHCHSRFRRVPPAPVTVSDNVILTSAMPIGARFREPLKMTSSIFSPRSDLALCSPRTHAMASETLLFPQPFGPTIAVTPSSWTTISPLSEKDLKPRSSMR